MNATIAVSRVRQSRDGLCLHFRLLDGLTQRPDGEEYVSSRVVDVGTLRDSRGSIHQGSQCMVVLSTESGSAYIATLPKTVANRLKRAVQKNMARKV